MSTGNAIVDGDADPHAALVEAKGVQAQTGLGNENDVLFVGGEQEVKQPPQQTNNALQMATDTFNRSMRVATTAKAPRNLEEIEASCGLTDVNKETPHK
jgi:hypothetical protein